MTAGRDTPGQEARAGVAGGPARHIPVLARPALDLLAVTNDGLYIDGTFGAGGYTRAILDAAPGARVIALDRDQTAIAAGWGLVEAAGGRLTLIESCFSDLGDVAAPATVAGVVLDIGVSSMQIDDPERGFSFRFDGPLDMRMGQDGPSAADLVAHASERDLADVIFQLGEERHSRAVARAIVKARADAPIVTTARLAEIVARVVRHKPGDIHPATRTFQALRMMVNDELGELARALVAAERVLAPGGRLVVVSFHSLEDRLVKTFLAGRAGGGGVSRHRPETVRPDPSFSILTKRPITADDPELIENPRARSAKLRAAERTGAAAWTSAPAGLPPLPTLDDMLRGG
ncbi:16S rRNA (cytosine(1402)-N(4))-methyltransferase [Rhodoplanes elegans]|uniref:Ribosomal RNA small subunit methyltransferase H n=1 Tax=Rhodoplanes elegans TaxID=29408 RepID=A0A327JZT5_9BRAD|nr:16S rRNA (cytosine(1402)-N(4))-methyltransferase RsmH [Rhodoplanes elegans]MBK5961054.1 16S rRNA (cytosine(1402)-N(4))-methyltransferase [Rhodoplanes elegans]RAI30552.1 16S rRNA (cytosine(1402)-N(4))-methyltransferase [Rhodoplanes elegans]